MTSKDAASSKDIAAPKFELGIESTTRGMYRVIVREARHPSNRWACERSLTPQDVTKMRSEFPAYVIGDIITLKWSHMTVELQRGDRYVMGDCEIDIAILLTEPYAEVIRRWSEIPTEWRARTLTVGRIRGTPCEIFVAQIARATKTAPDFAAYLGITSAVFGRQYTAVCAILEPLAMCNLLAISDIRARGVWLFAEYKKTAGRKVQQSGGMAVVFDIGILDWWATVDKNIDDMLSRHRNAAFATYRRSLAARSVR